MGGQGWPARSNSKVNRVFLFGYNPLTFVNGVCALFGKPRVNVAGRALGLRQQTTERFTRCGRAGVVKPRIGRVSEVEGARQPLATIVVGFVVLFRRTAKRRAERRAAKSGQLAT